MVDEADGLQKTFLVSGPADMARFLRSSSPARAREFALAAQERACWSDDENRIAFWDGVVGILARDEGERAAA